MDKIKHLYDLGYKTLFSNKTIFKQLLQSFVKADFVKHIDFNDLELVNKSFVSKKYKKTESDILYKTKIKDKEVYLYVLLEFQSSVDNFMALRFLNYITNFYLELVETNKDLDSLPPVFPILLYNGKPEWKSPIKISELIKNHELLGEYGINFKYFPVLENTFNKKQLLKIKNMVSTLFLAETNFDTDFLVKELTTLFEKEEDKKAISTLINFVMNLGMRAKIKEEDFTKLDKVYVNVNEVSDMLLEAVQEQRKKYEDKGISFGEERKAIDIAKKLLLKGSPVDFISEVTGLSIKEINRISK